MEPLRWLNRIKAPVSFGRGIVGSWINCFICFSLFFFFYCVTLQQLTICIHWKGYWLDESLLTLLLPISFLLNYTD